MERMLSNRGLQDSAISVEDNERTNNIWEFLHHGFGFELGFLVPKP